MLGRNKCMASCLLYGVAVECASLMVAAAELLEQGHYPSVVAVCSAVLADEPDNVPVRLMLARALIWLRDDALATRHLGEALELDPLSGVAFQLLGEIAMQREELASARIYFREALRLDPDNREARSWLDVVEALEQAKGPGVRRRAVTWMSRASGLARGTSPTLERPKAPVVSNGEAAEALAPPPPRRRGFGRYLVELGVLLPMELDRVLAHQRASGVRIGEAAVAMGYATAEVVQWAARGYHAAPAAPAGDAAR